MHPVLRQALWQAVKWELLIRNPSDVVDPPKVASERLGHSKVGITLDLYSHVMPGMRGRRGGTR
jgi:hypothetical protein